MNKVAITGSRLALPRVLNNVELAPERDAAPGGVTFDLGALGVERKTTDAVVIALWLPEQDGTFACLLLDDRAAKTLAEKILAVTA